MHIPLEPLHAPLLRLLPVHVRLWVSKLLELRLAEACIRRENGFAFYASEFGDPYVSY